MKQFYIASMDGNTALSKYSGDFYRLVLKDKGFIHIDSAETITTILSTISSRDTVFLELSSHLKKEVEILFRMLNANYRNVMVTLHDSPVVNLPFRSYKGTIQGRFLQAIDSFFNNFRPVLPYLRKLKAIFVLSKKTLVHIREKYKLQNVHYLPHIIDLSDIKPDMPDFSKVSLYVYAGNKQEYEYALDIFSKIVAQKPDTNLLIIKTPVFGRQSFKGMNLVDYTPEYGLSKITDDSSLNLVLNSDTRTYWPQNGRKLFSLKQGNILFSSKGNRKKNTDAPFSCVQLNGILSDDLKEIIEVIDNYSLRVNQPEMMRSFLKNHHSAEIVNHYLQDIQ
jgi:hypothetical protein